MLLSVLLKNENNKRAKEASFDAKKTTSTMILRNDNTMTMHNNDALKVFL